MCINGHTAGKKKKKKKNDLPTLFFSSLLCQYNNLFFGPYFVLLHVGGAYTSQGNGAGKLPQQVCFVREERSGWEGHRWQDRDRWRPSQVWEVRHWNSNFVTYAVFKRSWKQIILNHDMPFHRVHCPRWFASRALKLLFGKRTKSYFHGTHWYALHTWFLGATCCKQNGARYWFVFRRPLQYGTRFALAHSVGMAAEQQFFFSKFGTYMYVNHIKMNRLTKFPCPVLLGLNKSEKDI